MTSFNSDDLDLELNLISFKHTLNDDRDVNLAKESVNVASVVR